MSGRCEVRYTSDGQPVRVQGDISQEDLDRLGAAVQAHIDSRCDHEGPYVMPAVARRIHGRDYFLCGLDAGHDGDEHAWPADRDGYRWTTDGTLLSGPQRYEL